MKRVGVSLHLGFAALVLGGVVSAGMCATSAPQLGQNAAGESCRTDGVATPTAPVSIFCGDNTQSVGRLQAFALGADLPKDVAARRATILDHARIADLSIGEHLSCDAGQPLSNTGDGDTLIFLCTMQSNGWPRLIVVSGFDRTIYQGEGTLDLLPVLEATIAAASGHPVPQTEVEAGQRILAARFPETVLKAGTADFARYSHFIEIARAYSSANNYVDAETALRNALNIETRLFGPDSAPVGLALMELGLQVSNQGRFDEAAGLFQRATPIVQSLTSTDARARLDSYLALNAANQRDFAKAYDFARQATDDRRAELEGVRVASGATAAGSVNSPTISSGELAHALRIQAEMALLLDNITDAQASAEEALSIISLEPGLPLWWRADVLSLMAQVDERQGRISAAERNFLGAISLKQKLFGDSAPVTFLHLRIGRFYTEQQLYPQALEHFRAAMATLAKLPLARSAIVPDQIVPLIAAASSITANPQQRATLDAEIFRASQLSHFDVADQTIARASVRLAAGNPMLADLVGQTQDAERARDLARIDLAAEFAKPDDERNAAHETQLAQNLSLASARANELLAKVQQTFPDYAKLSAPGPAELSDVRAQLSPGDAFVSFVIGFRGSYGLLVTAQGLTVKRLSVTADSLAADIASLRSAFVPQIGILPAYSLRNAYKLYSQLLEPFAADLAGINHLIVVPGTDLANLPFSLLVSAAPTSDDNYRDAAWLIRKMSISQVPSPHAFLALRQNVKTRVAPPRPFVGLGDPLLMGDPFQLGQSGSKAALETLAVSCREDGPMPPGLLRGLPQLHDTAEEVNAAAKALGGDASSVLLGANASEASLRARPLDQYAVIYFATHGLLPGELHCQAEPGLVLSPPTTMASTADADGLLEASEIAALKLNADLIVLSACNTAAAGGGRFGGGALEGLADAFFNAGARAVLATQWQVPSNATTQLMVGVFQRYGQERARGVAEALRQSQLAMLNSPATAHPFYWAAFTLIGVSAESTASADIAVRTRQAAAD